MLLSMRTAAFNKMVNVYPFAGTRQLFVLQLYNKFHTISLSRPRVFGYGQGKD